MSLDNNYLFFFFSSRRRHTRSLCDWSSDVCSSDLGVTQMVKNEKQHIEKTRAKQGFPADSPEPYKIAASTPFDFGAKNLTPYGGLFPVSTMLEKLGFKKLIEETRSEERRVGKECRSR